MGYGLVLRQVPRVLPHAGQAIFGGSAAANDFAENDGNLGQAAIDWVTDPFGTRELSEGLADLYLQGAGWLAETLIPIHEDIPQPLTGAAARLPNHSHSDSTTPTVPSNTAATSSLTQPYTPSSIIVDSAWEARQQQLLAESEARQVAAARRTELSAALSDYSDKVFDASLNRVQELYEHLDIDLGNRHNPSTRIRFEPLRIPTGGYGQLTVDQVIPESLKTIQKDMSSSNASTHDFYNNIDPSLISTLDDPKQQVAFPVTLGPDTFIVSGSFTTAQLEGLIERGILNQTLLSASNVDLNFELPEAPPVQELVSQTGDSMFINPYTRAFEEKYFGTDDVPGDTQPMQAVIGPGNQVISDTPGQTGVSQQELDDMLSPGRGHSGDVDLPDVTSSAHASPPVQLEELGGIITDLDPELAALLNSPDSTPISANLAITALAAEVELRPDLESVPDYGIVIEDNPVKRMVAANKLKQAGVPEDQIKVADNFRDAIGLIQASRRLNGQGVILLDNTIFKAPADETSEEPRASQDSFNLLSTLSDSAGLAIGSVSGYDFRETYAWIENAFNKPPVESNPANN